MNTIIKNITKIFLFLIVLCFLLLIASYLFEPKTNNKEAGMRDVRLNAILGEKDNTLDVLFLGDSEVFSSISPMEMYNKHGFTSFVLGSAAQQLHYTKYLLSRTLKKQKPQVVILETNAIYRKIEPTGPIFRKLQNWFSIFEYHNRWKSLNFRDLNLSFSYEYNSEFKGYTYKPGIKGLKSWNYMNPTTESKEIEKLNKKKEQLNPNDDFKEYVVELSKKLDCTKENEEYIFTNNLGFSFLFDSLNRKAKKELIQKLIASLEISRDNNYNIEIKSIKFTDEFLSKSKKEYLQYLNDILNNNEIGIIYKEQVNKEKLEELSHDYTIVSLLKCENNEYSETELNDYLQLFKEHFYYDGIINCPYTENNLIIDHLLLIPKTKIIQEF